MEPRILLSAEPLGTQPPLYVEASLIQQDVILLDVEPQSSPQVFPSAVDALPAGASDASGEIHGSKWHDLDGDGHWDEGEPRLPGWIIYLDLDGNGELTPGEPSDTTDANGNYAFTGLEPGTYVVAEVPQDGWKQTYPGQEDIFASQGLDATAGFSASVETGLGRMQVHLTLDDFEVVCEPDGLHHVRVQSLSEGSEPGCPQLPGRLLRFALPMDADLDTVTVEVDAARQKTLAGRLNIAPAPLPASSAQGTATAGATVVAGRNVAVYRSDTYYNNDQITAAGVQQLGRWKIVEIDYSPFAYNPATGSLRVCEALDVTIRYETNAPLPSDLAASGAWDAYAAEMIDNFDEARSWYPSADAATPGYVIITTAAIESRSAQLAHFVAHKQSEGYDVTVITESLWGGGTGNAAAENLRGWLQANYAAMDIAYVLLIGNPNPYSGDVPMKVIYTSTPTDYYYADLTSDWDANGDQRYGEWGCDFSSKPMHEVLVGRVPFYGSYADLDHILRKTIDYETESDVSWRRSILLPMAISSYAGEYGSAPPTDGHSLAEHILSDVADPNGYAAFTLYEKEGLEPVADPCDMPLSRNAVVDEWSSNPYGMVAWWAHGNETGAYRKYWGYDDGDGKPESHEMVWPGFFSSNDVTGLDDDHPSVVVQVSCLNGYPENRDNLAYKLLTHGAVATFSASRGSWYVEGDWHPDLGLIYGDNASYAFYITDRLIGNPATETSGAALQWCRENFGTSWGAASWFNSAVFNLYGDPSLHIGAQSPGYGYHTVALGPGDVVDVVHFGNRELPAPEITVFGNEVLIHAGDTTADAEDGTDFGLVGQGGPAVSRTFTVRNDGGTPLTLGPIAVPAGFTLIEGLPASLAPGAWNTFTVRLDTAATGVKSGDISFPTNDADEDPFCFRITGVVSGPPEIVVLGNDLVIVNGDSLPGLTDGTDFGTCVQGQPGPTRTFTVRNDGITPLMLGPVVVPSGFTLIEGLAESLESGAEDTFTVRLDNTVAGTRSGDVSFANNDPDENPHRFRIVGRVHVEPPEVIVLGNGTSITDGDTTPAPTDGTDFGSVAQRSTPIDRTFTVRNEGGSTLLLGRVMVPYGFTLVEGLSTSLAPGASDTFTVRLSTTYVTTRSGQISFTSNDGNESPFNFTITGRILPPQVPEVEVRGNGRVILDGDLSPSTTDHTDFGTAIQNQAGPTRTFTVYNTGTAALTLGAVSVPTGFTLVEGLPGTLAAGASETFTIRLDTATGGIKTGDVVFTNSDGNESPFNFRIRGTVQAPPAEIVVLGNGASITDGDTTPTPTDGTDFGSAAQRSTPIDRTFTVRNEGGSTLTLGRVIVPYGFTLVEGLSTSLAPGASDTFTVRLNTTYVATRSGQISFTSNDGNESPFNFTITGRILPPQVPEVEVRGNGRVILDGDLSPSTTDHTDFGTAIQDQAGPTRTFTVYNTGTAALTLGGVSVPTGFTLVEGLPATLAAGASETFTIRLDTATGGIKTGDVVFTNSDGNESPFNFRIRGTVQAPPAEIVVLGNGTSITDGDTTPTTTDGTDFGSAAQRSTPIDRTFTVRNEGGSTLLLGRVTVPYGFTLVEGLSTSLAPGASDTFTVRLNTTYAATRSGQISFTSNDGNESPFNFTITGRVLLSSGLGTWRTADSPRDDDRTPNLLMTPIRPT